MKINNFDLHIHSVFSDGTNTPEEIVEMALNNGIKTISITDHDTIAHIKNSLMAGEQKGVDVIPGVEVSADYSEGTMHILGYFVDYNNEELFDMLLKFRKGREVRNPQIIKKLNDLGIEIKYEEVLKEAAGASVGRPHIARVLFEKGYVKNEKEAFSLYLAKGAKAYCDRYRLDAKTIISTIHKAGGLAFLAHPKQLKIEDFQELQNLINKLMDFGLDGMEVYSSCHNEKEIETYKVIATKNNLLISGGSDFHGRNKKNIPLGFLGTKTEISDNLIIKMREKQDVR